MTSRTLWVVQTASGRGPLARLTALVQAEREMFPLWLPVALGAGVVSWFLLPWQAQRLGLAVMAGGFGLGLFLMGRRWPATLMLMIVLGLGASEFRSTRTAHLVLPDRRMASLTASVVTIEPRLARDQLRLLLDVDPQQGVPDRVRVTLRGHAAVRAMAAEGLGSGARVELRAMLMPPAGPMFPGGFDASRSLWFDDVGATGTVLGPLRVLSSAPEPEGLMAWLADIRRALTRRITTSIPGEAGAVATVFVTGDRGAVPEDAAQAVRDAGLAHLLSISGLHMAVVVGGVVWLMRRILGLFPWLALRVSVKALALLAGAAAGLGYTLMAGSEVPTVRSLIATLIVLAGLLAGRDAISLRLLAAGAFVILLVRPEALMGPSFQMSFAAVAAIVALYETTFAKRMFGPDAQVGWGLLMLRGLLALVATGFVAEVALSPIGLFHFQQSGLYGMMANLLAIPLASFGIIPALVLGLLGDALGLGAVSYRPAGWMVEGLLDIAYWTAALPGAVARLPVMPSMAFGLIVLGGLWLILWRTNLRLGGVPMVIAGAVLALMSPPPDLLVSRDGRHVALRTAEGPLAFLRPRTGAILQESWSAAVGNDNIARKFDDVPGMNCSHDSCLGQVGSRTLFATRSREMLMQDSMQPACEAADIVVSERRLPDWCSPRWLRLDQQALERRGAVAIWLESGRVRGARDNLGDHPWAGVSKTM